MVLQVAHGATTTFKVSGDMLEIFLEKVFDKDLPHNLDLSQRDENDFRPVESIVRLKKILG